MTAPTSPNAAASQDEQLTWNPARSLRPGVVAVIRMPSSASALTLARGLSGSGVDAIEVTMTVPSAQDVITTLVAEGVNCVGAGTVRTVAQVDACARAGARFVVSPYLDGRVVEAALEHRLDVVPGVLTPTELATAMAWGATAAKIFPVTAVGGTSYVRAILEPLPDARLVISGEVAPSEVEAYIDAGAWAVCLGAPLWRQADIDAGDIDGVAEFGRSALAACRRQRVG